MTEDLHDQAFLDRLVLGFDEAHLPEGAPTGSSYRSYLLGLSDGVVKTPEWAEPLTGVPAATIRRLADQYLTHARVGATTVVDGVLYPHRPVAVLLGKTVKNGWGGYECCWARTVLAALVGALEVPGGILGTTVRLRTVRPPSSPAPTASWSSR